MEWFGNSYEDLRRRIDSVSNCAEITANKLAGHAAVFGQYAGLGLMQS